MITTKKAKKVLKKSEQKHLTECGINSMAAMRRQEEFMKGKDHFEVCLECRHISNKLRLDDV